ncbi:dihydroneopterin aldolase [Tropicimonas isoalkanivorans]|uniref:dihydroneopterin aldolase n=1 Tax=Tropicimonas isoalkanivorans TaxID=441112 RepID=A0A1I1NMF6_9RHOB|nr:dihydroneopterin aldolase [Tropicimonas isoalkanivorans]SFC98625.1 dihydroneopterin aldolase [Tropicimonas isoalkanivorans]
MTSELSLAFSHPERRAAATASDDDPRDRISLRDYVREAEIGAFQEERGVAQRLRFNVVVEVGHAAAPLTDDVDRILSYDVIVEAIDTVLSEERMSLLETLAERIAERLLAEPRARRVFVRIEKLDRGPFALGVEIERARASTRPVEAEPGTHPRPLVLYLSNAAITDARLPTWLDQLERLERPVVLTVGLPERDPPKAGAAMPQRRIDLLALEQNAWVLAARDRRCLVVSSRTEITHAIHEGRIVVWAPSKIVLDAVEKPDAGPRAPEELARWFAETMRAERFLGLGSEVPGGDRLALVDALAL